VSEPAASVVTSSPATSPAPPAPRGGAVKPRNPSKLERDKRMKRVKRAVAQLEQAHGLDQLEAKLEQLSNPQKVEEKKADPAELNGAAYAVWSVAAAVPFVAKAIADDNGRKVECAGCPERVSPKLKLLIEATAPVMSKYMPSILSGLEEEAGLVLTVVMVFGPVLLAGAAAPEDKAAAAAPTKAAA
jgi:hypothetical protein